MMHADQTLSARLKAETHDQHIRAERHPVQHELVSGRTSAAGYAAYLAQMYWVHHSLESNLSDAVTREAAEAQGPLGAVVREYHRRLPQIEADLAFFDAEVGQNPASPATQRFAEWIGHTAQTRPTALLGGLYVLEGSTNGGRYIARALRRALSLADGRGTAFFDPHGEAQTERWHQFKTDLDSLALDAAAQATVVAAAGRTFDAIVEIMDDLAAAGAMQPAGVK